MLRRRTIGRAVCVLAFALACGTANDAFAGGNVQGTSCTAGVSAGIQTGAVTDANNLVCVSGTWQYPVYVVQSAAAAAGSSCSSYPAGAVRYNTTLSNTEFCNGSNWQSLGVGGGKLIGIYSSGTAVSNNSIVFTGAANSAPSLSGTTLTLPSNAAYIVVELWGAGGGGGGGGTGTNGSAGNSSCFGTNSTACTSPIFSAAGGGAGFAIGNSGAPAGGGSGSGGDVNLTGSGGAGDNTTNATAVYMSGGVGGSAPLGGGGGSDSWISAGSAGAAYGGGGGGGGNYNSGASCQSGEGGSGGGYASKFVSGPSGTYYYTIGSGGSAGSAGSCGGNSYNGGAGGAGGITISVYTAISSASNGTIASAGTAGDLAYYTATGTNISPLATANNGVLATNSSGTPFISTAMTVTTTSVGIGTPTPASLGNGGSPKIVQIYNAGTNAYGDLELSSNSTTSGNVVGAVDFGTTGAAGEQRSASIQSYLLGTSTAAAVGDLQFYTSNGTTAAERMRIDNAGNVGIGTTSPGAILDVNGLARTLETSVSYPSSGAGMELYSISGSGAGAGSHVQAYNRSGSAWRNLYLDASNLILNSNSTGNVGIGTTSPQETLDNAGSSLIRGSWASDTINGLHEFFSSNVGSIYSIQNGTAWRQLNIDASALGRL